VHKLLRFLRYAIPLGTLFAFAVGFLVTRLTREPVYPPKIAPAPDAMLQPLERPARTKSLSGTLVGPDGAPVGDALVWLRAGDEPHWTYTDGTGDFRFEYLGAAPWAVSVVARGFTPQRFELADTGTVQTIRLASAVEPIPSLPAIASSTLAGVVIPALPGETDLAGLEVLLTPLAPPETLSAPVPRRVATDRDGRFAITDLVHGEYGVRVLPHWARGGSWPDLTRALDAKEPLRWVHGPSTAANEMRIQLESGSITATIKSAEDAPLEAALVLIAPAADPSRVWPPISTAADGTFTARDLPPGAYAVSVHAGAAVVTQSIDVAPRSVQRAAFAPLETAHPR
jgi:hypothetical protein